MAIEANAYSESKKATKAANLNFKVGITEMAIRAELGSWGAKCPEAIVKEIAKYPDAKGKAREIRMVLNQIDEIQNKDGGAWKGWMQDYIKPLENPIAAAAFVKNAQVMPVLADGDHSFSYFGWVLQSLGDKQVADLFNNDKFRYHLIELSSISGIETSAIFDTLTIPKVRDLFLKDVEEFKFRIRQLEEYGNFEPPGKFLYYEPLVVDMPEQPEKIKAFLEYMQANWLVKDPDSKKGEMEYSQKKINASIEKLARDKFVSISDRNFKSK